MGWGRLLLLGNVGQQLDIEETKSEIQSLRQKATWKDLDQDRKILAIQDENDQLKLTLVAMIRLLRSKGMLDDASVLQLVDSLEEESDAR